MSTWTQLTWAHFKILLTVKNPEKRNEYDDEAEKDVYELAKNGLYLNQRLLENNLATKYYI